MNSQIPNRILVSRAGRSFGQFFFSSRHYFQSSLTAPMATAGTELNAISTVTSSIDTAATPTFSHQLPIKLDSSNYALWKTLMRTMIAGSGLFHHIDGSKIAPATQQADGQQKSAFQQWFRQDQQVLSWVFNSISPSLLPQVICGRTAHEVWLKLEHAYASGSKA